MSPTSYQTALPRDVRLNWMAEKLGFEPRRRANDLPVFKTGPFSHLGTSPKVLENGGPCRTRTYDPPVMSRMLWPTELRVQNSLVAEVRLELTTFRVWTGCSSQLSYPAKKIKMVGTTGFEPATPWSQIKCTTKLCYVPILKGWRAQQESNPQPFDP